MRGQGRDSRDSARETKMKTFLTFFLMSFSISSGIIIGLAVGSVTRDVLLNCYHRLSDRFWVRRTFRKVKNSR